MGGGSLQRKKSFSDLAEEKKKTESSIKLQADLAANPPEPVSPGKNNFDGSTFGQYIGAIKTPSFHETKVNADLASASTFGKGFSIGVPPGIPFFLLVLVLASEEFFARLESMC